MADKKAGIEIDGKDATQANHKDDGRNVLYQDGHVKWKRGPDALDPDEDDDQIGKPYDRSFTDWWSDPPWYDEKTYGY
jgi:prepilin-type processing-associated H-X9-DG protein